MPAVRAPAPPLAPLPFQNFIWGDEGQTKTKTNRRFGVRTGPGQVVAALGPGPLSQLRAAGRYHVDIAASAPPKPNSKFLSLSEPPGFSTVSRLGQRAPFWSLP